jgi:hypothetical protein
LHFEGTIDINAPREKVWEFLTNPEFVSQCAPGLQSVEVLIPNEKFRAVASVGFGSVKATFDNEVQFVELDALNYAKVSLHGSAPGSAVDVTSEMRLSDNSDGTTKLDWSAEVAIMGTLASLASRLMGSVTNKLTSAFFDCVKKKIER